MSTKKLQIIDGVLKYDPATTTADGLMSSEDKAKLDGIATGANKTVVDSALSGTSTNPVQNKVINTAISNLNTLVGDTSVATQITNAKNGCITGLSVSGRTVTYTKGDGSIGTITTQDTDTTYGDMTGATASTAGQAGLVPAPSAGTITKYLRSDGTWQDINIDLDIITNDEIDEICGATLLDQSEVQV